MRSERQSYNQPSVDTWCGRQQSSHRVTLNRNNESYQDYFEYFGSHNSDIQKENDLELNSSSIIVRSESDLNCMNKFEMSHKSDKVDIKKDVHQYDYLNSRRDLMLSNN